MSPTDFGLGFATSFAQNYFNYRSQQETNIANRDMAREQMDFQREMDNSKHQREVQDLIKAGLNPTLSAGSAGSAPSGTSAVMQAPQVHMPDFLAYGIQQKQLENEAQKIATDKGRLQNETNLTAAQISNLNAEAKSKEFQAKVADMAKSAMDNVKKMVTTPKLDEPENFRPIQKPIKVNYEKRKKFDSNLKNSLSFGTIVQPKP